MAEAARWYETHRVGLGTEFLDAVDAVVVRIAETPRMGSRVPGVSDQTIRRRPVRRFPYHSFTWSFRIGSASDLRRAIQRIWRSAAGQGGRRSPAEAPTSRTAVRRSIALDLALLERYDTLLRELELDLVHQAKQHDPQAFQLLRSVPGMGNVHLKWAFSEAAVLFLRRSPRGQEPLRRLAGRHGKTKALSGLPRDSRPDSVSTVSACAASAW